MRRKTRSFGHVELMVGGAGCERQMGEAGASVFSSCLLAQTLTTRLRPFRFFCPLSLALCLAFHFIFSVSGSLHSPSTTSLVPTLHVLCDIC